MDIDKISKLRTPKQLFSFLENNVDTLFNVSFLKIFVLDDSTDKYVLKKSITRQKDTSGESEDIRLGLEDPIVTHLLEIKKAVCIKEIDKNISVALTKNRQFFLYLLRDKLIELEAEVCVAGFAQDKLVNVFILGKKISKEVFSDEEINLFSALAEQSAKVIDNFNSIKKEAELFVNSIRKINKALENKDIYTRGHSHRVAQFSVIVAGKLRAELEKIPYEEISLYYAAEFHDVGKINLPDSMLQKHGELDEEEWKQMKKHTLESAKIIKPLEKWFGKIVIDGVLYHHENYDGSGYPYGKKGERINILARIIRVADSFDAMITDRPYREALVQHNVIAELKRCRGTKFDPKVTDVFLEAYREGLFKEIFLSQLADEGQE